MLANWSDYALIAYTTSASLLPIATNNVTL